MAIPFIFIKMKNESIAFKELELNIKHQNIQVDEFTQIGYEFDDGVYVFMLLFPFNLKKIMKGGSKC